MKFPAHSQFISCMQRIWPRFSPVPRVRRGPLRVAFVITSMPIGGAEVLLANLVRSLDRQRISPEIICLKSPGPLGEELRRDCPVTTDFLSSRLDIRVLPRLMKHFRENEVDAVVTVGAGDKMFWGRIAAWLAGVPVIFSALHSTGWPDGVGRLNRLLTPITDGFIAVANDHAIHLAQNERFPSKRVFTIRNGVDTARFLPDAEKFREARTRLGIPLDAPTFGVVAALRPEKHHEMFLKVAQHVSERCPDAWFLIVGDGPERQNIEAIRARLGLEERVLMLGARSDTPDLLNTLDGFLLCSHNEASPVSILEALACEVPVVATDVGSVHESVVADKTGFLVNPGDDRAMADRVIELISNPELHREIAARGRRLVQSSASLESMVSGYMTRIEGLYDARCERRRPQSEMQDRRRHPRVPYQKPDEPQIELEPEAASQPAGIAPASQASEESRVPEAIH